MRENFEELIGKTVKVIDVDAGDFTELTFNEIIKVEDRWLHTMCNGARYLLEKEPYDRLLRDGECFYKSFRNNHLYKYEFEESCVKRQADKFLKEVKEEVEEDIYGCIKKIVQKELVKNTENLSVEDCLFCYDDDLNVVNCHFALKNSGLKLVVGHFVDDPVGSPVLFSIWRGKALLVMDERPLKKVVEVINSVSYDVLDVPNEISSETNTSETNTNKNTKNFKMMWILILGLILTSIIFDTPIFAVGVTALTVISLCIGIIGALTFLWLIFFSKEVQQ